MVILLTHMLYMYFMVYCKFFSISFTCHIIYFTNNSVPPLISTNLIGSVILIELIFHVQVRKLRRCLRTPSVC